MDTDKYRVEIGDPLVETDKERLFGLWRKVNFNLFGSEANAELRYHWFYRCNPHGPARIYFLVDSQQGEVVGAVGAGTRLFAGRDETPLRASLLVDFIVVPAHRSLFPALLLQRKAREFEAQNADLVYGLPDVKAVPVFKRLGSDEVLKSYRYSRVLRMSRFAARYLPGYLASSLGAIVDRARAILLALAVQLQDTRSVWAEEFDGRYDELWRQSSHKKTQGWGERSSAFLRWRFSYRPSGGELRTLVISANRGRDFCAYFVCLQNGAEMIVPDFLLTGGIAEMAGQMRALTLAAWRNGAEVIRVDFAGHSEVLTALRSAGFIRRGEPRPCFLMFKANISTASRPQSWCFTRADEDVY